MLRLALLGVLVASSGCKFLPQIAYEPTIHNPFPQLERVAVIPFVNLSTEPTVNGRDVAIAYFDELQSIPGFDVAPVGVTEVAIRDYQIRLDNPAELRRLAKILEVDAVVYGVVTDFNEYYPPRMGLLVEWYAANPCFHPIPVGYGLPWGTPAEDDIPADLTLRAEFELAKAQMATQTPRDPSQPGVLKPPPEAMQPLQSPQSSEPVGEQPEAQEINYEAVSGVAGSPAGMDPPAGFPPDWPDSRGFLPEGPRKAPLQCQPSDKPILRHTRIFDGHNADFTAALDSYFFFQDDARFGGARSYMQRKSDFVRFCCRMHIAEMLTARGGAGESRVVWRWPADR